LNDDIVDNVSRSWIDETIFVPQVKAGIDDKMASKKMVMVSMKTVMVSIKTVMVSMKMVMVIGLAIGQPGHIPPIIEKRPCIYHFLPTFDPRYV